MLACIHNPDGLRRASHVAALTILTAVVDVGGNWRLWGGADSHLTNRSLVSRPQLFTLRRQRLPIIDLTLLFGQLTPSPSVQCLSTRNENSGGGDEMEILYIYLKWEQGCAGG